MTPGMLERLRVLAQRDEAGTLTGSEAAEYSGLLRQWDTEDRAAADETLRSQALAWTGDLDRPNDAGNL